MPRAELGPEDKRATVQSLARGLRILNYIIDAADPPRLHDVALAFEIDKAAAFRILNTLCRYDLAIKDPRKRYRPGSRLTSWTSMANPEKQVIELIRPHLEDLAHRTRQSTHLGVLAGDQVLVVDYVPSDSMVHVRDRKGTYAPLHCTAVGKALLAHAPPQAQAELVDRALLRKFTARTITTKRGLRNELDRVRSEGIAIDDCEYNDLVICLASPVIGPDKHAIASVGLSTFKMLTDQDRRLLEKLKGEVRRTAAHACALFELNEPPNRAGGTTAQETTMAAKRRLERSSTGIRQHGGGDGGR